MSGHHDHDEWYITQKERNALSNWYSNRKNYFEVGYQLPLWQQPPPGMIDPLPTDNQLQVLNFIPELEDASTDDAIGRRVAHEVELDNLEIRLEVTAFRPCTFRIMIIQDKQPEAYNIDWTVAERNEWHIRLAESLFGGNYIRYNAEYNLYHCNGWWLPPIFDNQQRFNILCDRVLNYEGSGFAGSATSNGFKLKSDPIFPVDPEAPPPVSMKVRVPKVANAVISSLTMDGGGDLDAEETGEITPDTGIVAITVTGAITGNYEITQTDPEIPNTITQVDITGETTTDTLWNFEGEWYQDGNQSTSYNDVLWKRAVVLRLPNLMIRTNFNTNEPTSITVNSLYLGVFPSMSEDAINPRESMICYSTVSYNDHRFHPKRGHVLNKIL